MTVATQTNRTSAVGSGAIGQEVPFLFPIKATSDLLVKKRVTATGVETTLDETTNYTVVIDGDLGGTLTTVTAVETTEQIHIIGNPPNTQSLDLVQGGSYNAEKIEDALDKNTRLTTKNYDKITNKAITFPETDASSLTTILPSSIDRASKNLTFDSDGNVTASVSVEEGSVSFSTFGTNMAEAANALAAKAVINLNHVLDVRDYGALGDGSTDDSTAFQDAIDACPTGGGVIVPSTTTSWRVANLVINKPMSLFGLGFGSKLQAVTGATGYIIQIDGAAAGAITRTDLGFLGGTHTCCVGIDNLYLEGNARAASIGGLYINEADWGTYRNLRIFNFVRESINCYSGLRESLFDNINTRWCGSDTTYPNINLNDQADDTAESHNNLLFRAIFSIYCLGDHVQMDTLNGKSLNVRNIRFENSMFHGIIATLSGAGNNPFDITFDAGEKAFKIFDIGTAEGISITNSLIHAMGLEVPGIDIATGSNGDPAEIRITNNRFNTRYDGSQTANDIGIHLQNGNLLLAGNVISGTDGASITIKTESGTSLYHGANRLSGGDPVIAGGVFYSDLAGAKMNWQDTDFSNLKGVVVGASVPASDHRADVSCADTGVLNLKEATATPTANTGHGKIYTRDDNKAHFQDGAGVSSVLLRSSEVVCNGNQVVCNENQIVYN